MMGAVIYRLKRSYGLPIKIHHEDASGVDLATGKKTVTRSAVTVTRAILLPALAHKEFKYDIGYLKANSNFTYGGLFTSSTRLIIVDKHELPPGYVLTATDDFYVVFHHRRYVIKAVTELEVPAYFVAVEFTGGVPTYEVHSECVFDRLLFDEGVSP
jgi:hypothetical protein